MNHLIFVISSDVFWQRSPLMLRFIANLSLILNSSRPWPRRLSWCWPVFITKRGMLCFSAAGMRDHCL